MSAHFRGFGTIAVHAGQEPEKETMNQVVPSISMATTYKQPFPGQPLVHDYARAGNPTRDALQINLAALENAQFCRFTFVFIDYWNVLGKVYSSGLATTSAIANLLKAGEHIICNDDGYGGTQRFFRRISGERHGVIIDLVDLTSAAAFCASLKPETKLVWFETPSNPLLKIVDIAEITEIAHNYNPDIVVVVDNTFMTPYFQRPLEFGVDIVIHSLTKYLNGHSDVVMGAAMTNREDLNEHLFFMQLAVGSVPSPFDCYLANRGAKTLHLRMRAHMENGLAVAQFLESNSRVERVLYPELESHPQHKIHKKQARGMSGMISFYIRGGLEESRNFLASLKIFTLAESLGGYESLAELPSVMTHASVPADERARIGITDNLIRISVGIEDKEDLIADLDAALKKSIKVEEPTSPIAVKSKQPSKPVANGIAVYA
ncbi:Gamma-cystathionase [Aphelenchoides besseyi]|nr:Gamma-cystathionase [Aphelenchoides besseyi]KAI6228087.1 Gamma-cystathionase [Aphelenchoides besseyi]